MPIIDTQNIYNSKKKLLRNQRVGRSWDRKLWNWTTDYDYFD